MLVFRNLDFKTFFYHNDCLFFLHLFQRAPGVRLPSSLGGGHYIVSKQSPLIKRNLSRRREIESLARAEINRALNAPLLQKNQEIIPAKYKLIKTYNGFQRVLVPAIDNAASLVQVSMPRKPFQTVNKRLPPALIDTADKSQQSNKNRKQLVTFPPPLLDTALKSESNRIVQNRPAKLHVNPPPLIDTSKFNSIKKARNINSRLGPPTLIDTAQISQPMEVEENVTNLRPSSQTFMQSTKVGPATIVNSSSVPVPPLIDSRSKKRTGPPVVDLVSDEEDDIKPLLVNKKYYGQKNSSLSLNERFTFIKN